MSKSAFTLFIIGALVTLSTSCDTVDMEEARLTYLTVDEVGLTAEIVRGDARIEVDFLRGAARPEETVRAQPELGGHELDVMVRDRSGHAFLLEFGGHGPSNAEWLALIQPPEAELDDTQRQEDLALAREAALVLADAPDAVRHYGLAIDALALLAQDVPQRQADAPVSISDLPGDGVGATAALAHGSDDELETLQGAVHDGGLPDPHDPDHDDRDERLSWGSSEPACTPGEYEHKIRIRAVTRLKLIPGGAFGMPGTWVPVMYEHSATRLRVYQYASDCSKTHAVTVNTNNHGESVMGDGMEDQYNCPRSFPDRTTYLPLLQPYDGSDEFADGDAGGCDTWYNPLPGFHVCNDDSLVQYWMVKYELTEVHDFDTCNDLTLRITSPDCFHDTNSDFE